ncbi:MAG: lipopolysaccharide transport periplasmic protein LptA [Gammaproteobacteria bacterium]|jgi:lipopolysaccharide export system protein LptA
MSTNNRQAAYRTINIIALSLFWLACSSAMAAENEPINIEADNAKIIEKEGKSIYSGNVVLIQATTRMTADIVTVYSKDGKVSRIIAKGKPVTYHQVNKPENEDITGQANLLEYQAAHNRIVLKDSAKLTQGRTAFSGNRIEYNISTDVVTAQTSESGKERVQVTIQPEDTGEKSSK